MSCRFKIKEANTSLTDAEKRIAEYILSHAEETLHMSSQKIAELTGTSPATLIRFSRKVGYSGFSELKMDLAKDSDDVEPSFMEVIQESDSTSRMISKAQNIMQMCIDQTYKLVNVTNLDDAIHLLNQCRSIYLFGVGGSGVVCEDLMQKLLRINRSVYYHSDMHVQLASAAHMTKDDVVIAVSYEGETRDVNVAVRHAKSVGAKTIAITQYNPKSTLARTADIALYTPVLEKSLRMGAITSRSASLIVTDLLYYGIAKQDLSEVKEDLVKTRDLTNEIR